MRIIIISKIFRIILNETQKIKSKFEIFRIFDRKDLKKNFKA